MLPTVDLTAISYVDLAPFLLSSPRARRKLTALVASQQRLDAGCRRAERILDFARLRIPDPFLTLAAHRIDT